MSKKDQDARQQLQRIRRKIAGTKPKNSDQTTFSENLKGVEPKTKPKEHPYHGHHREK